MLQLIKLIIKKFRGINNIKIKQKINRSKFQAESNTKIYKSFLKKEISIIGC